MLQEGRGRLLFSVCNLAKVGQVLGPPAAQEAAKEPRSGLWLYLGCTFCSLRKGHRVWMVLPQHCWVPATVHREWLGLHLSLCITPPSAPSPSCPSFCGNSLKTSLLPSSAGHSTVDWFHHPIPFLQHIQFEMNYCLPILSSLYIHFLQTDSSSSFQPACNQSQRQRPHLSP